MKSSIYSLLLVENTSVLLDLLLMSITIQIHLNQWIPFKQNEKATFLAIQARHSSGLMAQSCYDGHPTNFGHVHVIIFLLFTW